MVLRKGNNTPFFFRFQKGANKPEALIDGLPNGQYTADIDSRTKGLNWDFFGVERLALDGPVVVAHETWTCNNDCPGKRCISI